mmetsp:Transcript_31196/g.85542  ORF Transcript_31196/g.85542 Transcript_31196/m.85542 type:complete len:314 (-) Transcript_31196:465-1406(-)
MEAIAAGRGSKRGATITKSQAQPRQSSPGFQTLWTSSLTPSEGCRSSGHCPWRDPRARRQSTPDNFWVGSASVAPPCVRVAVGRAAARKNRADACAIGTAMLPMPLATSAQRILRKTSGTRATTLPAARPRHSMATTTRPRRSAAPPMGARAATTRFLARQRRLSEVRVSACSSGATPCACKARSKVARVAVAQMTLALLFLMLVKTTPGTTASRVSAKPSPQTWRLRCRFRPLACASWTLGFRLGSARERASAARATVRPLLLQPRQSRATASLSTRGPGCCLSCSTSRSQSQTQRPRKAAPRVGNLPAAPQ